MTNGEQVEQVRAAEAGRHSDYRDPEKYNV